MSRQAGFLQIRDPDPYYWEQKSLGLSTWEDLYEQIKLKRSWSSVDDSRGLSNRSPKKHKPEPPRSQHRFSIQSPQPAPSREMHQTHSRLLSLPPELRLHIYNHVADFKLGSLRVENQGGRSRFRVDWTAKALPEDEKTRELYSLMAVCNTTRRELLPIFLRGYIVKFPSWDPGFKLQCMYWIDRVTDNFVSNIDFVWLEGVYWRFSIALGRSIEDEKEDGKASKEDFHRYHGVETMAYSKDGIEFFLKVEFARKGHIAQAASEACRKMYDMLAKVLIHRGEDRLGKVELMWLIQETPLCGSEQMPLLRWG